MTRKQGNGRSGRPPENDSGLSPQQMMEMGQAAAHLLQNPVYNVAHQLVIQEIQEKWATTSVQEVKLRESLWAEMQATAKAALRLSEMVERAKELVQRQADQQDHEAQEYFDNQGFGQPPMSGDQQFQ